MNEPINFFDLTPQEVPVTLAGKSYVLREASGAAACTWRNAQLKCTKLQDGKPVGIDGLADTEPLLVSLCLFEVQETSAGRSLLPVLLNVVRGWPAKVVKRLFETAKTMSDLTEEETLESLQKERDAIEDKIEALEQRKNLLSSTTDGST